MCVTECGCLLSLVLALCLSFQAVMGHSVTVQLRYTTLDPGTSCIGGDVGLTNTSVLLQYRLLVEEGDAREWTDLTALETRIQQLITVMESLDLDSSVQGVQFRLLQLEHGGGSCHCWTLDSMSVMLDEQPLTTLSYQEDICFPTGATGTFCDGNAREARGMVTRVFYFPGSSGTECANHGDTLIASRGPSLPQDCTAMTPRL